MGEAEAQRTPRRRGPVVAAIAGGLVLVVLAVLLIGKLTQPKEYENADQIANVLAAKGVACVAGVQSDSPVPPETSRAFCQGPPGMGIYVYPTHDEALVDYRNSATSSDFCSGGLHLLLGTNWWAYVNGAPSDVASVLHPQEETDC